MENPHQTEQEAFVDLGPLLHHPLEDVGKRQVGHVDVSRNVLEGFPGQLPGYQLTTLGMPPEIRKTQV